MYKTRVKDAIPHMANTLKAAQLREESGDPKRLSVTALRPLDGRNGFAFAIVDVHARQPDADGPAALVLEHVERLALAFGADAHAQHRFEQFLGALNETLAQKVGAGEWNVPIQNFNALVGIACDEQMFLSGTGDLTALFMHRTRDQRYQVFNLFRSIQTEQSLPTWEKAFAVVLDGDLHASDVFCASNRDLVRYIAAEELNAILATLPPKSAVAKLRQYFPASADLSLLIVQSAESANEEVARPLASVSLDHLARTENETEALLEDQTPHPLTSLKERMRKLNAGARTSSVWRSVWRLLISSAMVAWRMTARSARVGASTVVTLAKPDTRKAFVASARERADAGVRGLFHRFNRLPKATKTLSLAAVGILFVLAAGITVLQHAQARSAEIAAYEARVAAVQSSIEKAAGAVIYKDEDQARALYGEALALAKALPTDTDDRAKAAAGLQAQIESAFNDLRHLVNIPEPTLLGDLSPNGATGRALLSSGAGVYVLGSDKKLYLLDGAKRALNATDASVGEIGMPVSATGEDGTLLALDDRPGVDRVDVENKTIQLTNVQAAPGTRWTDIALYNGKLYALEPTTGQIIKYNPASGGDYDGGTKWIRAKSTDLSDAVSMAIDATVFVLKQNGRIIRFVGGSEVGWTQGVADPAIASASDVWTSVASAYVYALDPGTERLVVYAKDGGSLVTQYRSDAFRDLTDFLVDETNKTIYFLAGSKLYSITASHLK